MEARTRSRHPGEPGQDPVRGVGPDVEHERHGVEAELDLRCGGPDLAPRHEAHQPSRHPVRGSVDALGPGETDGRVGRQVAKPRHPFLEPGDAVGRVSRAGREVEQTLRHFECHRVAEGSGHQQVVGYGMANLRKIVGRNRTILQQPSGLIGDLWIGLAEP
jgi:hypothetical protein